MGISQKLELRQSQSLVMTPQLMQAIRLLQLSSMDVVAFVAEELERNPLLSTDSEAEAAQNGTESSAQEKPPEQVDHRLDMDMENVFPDDAPEQKREQASDEESYNVSSWSGVSTGMGSGESSNLEAYVPTTTTLHEHLKSQLNITTLDVRYRMIGAALIDAIDETGYLREECAVLAERLGAQDFEVEAVLQQIQTFEPSGVGGRSLEECLSIQLKEQNRFDPAMQVLLKNLSLMARHDLVTLRRMCGVDEDDFKEMLAELRRLNPKPGLAYGFEPVQPVVPDVIIRHGADGGWLIELNAETMPRVLVNQTYYAHVSKQAKTTDDKVFIAECLQTANWLTRSLEQRARTILKVASEIARHQDRFLSEGIEYLRPLNLKTIAEAVEMHESTVSRVTANKYVATPRGIFELKYFFSSGIANAEGGESYSAETVRHRIKQLIESEKGGKILSDDDIVRLLGEVGVEVARRTVAKYREALGIPSSVQRRRLNAMRS